MPSALNDKQSGDYCSRIARGESREMRRRLRQYLLERYEDGHPLEPATRADIVSLSAEAQKLLLTVGSDHTYSRNKNPTVRRIGKLIENNLRQELSLKEMARITNLSSSRLSHMFKTETGTSPARCVKTARICEARSLLETTLLSVKEIAFRVGLKDGSHFVKDFKKTYGLPPARYRAHLLAQSDVTAEARKAS